MLTAELILPFTVVLPNTDNLAVFVEGLDLEVLLAVAVAVLAEEDPHQGIVYGGLAGGVITVDRDVVAVEVDVQATVAFEIA